MINHHSSIERISDIVSAVNYNALYSAGWTIRNENNKIGGP